MTETREIRVMFTQAIRRCGLPKAANGWAINGTKIWWSIKIASASRFGIVTLDVDLHRNEESGTLVGLRLEVLNVLSPYLSDSGIDISDTWRACHVKSTLDLDDRMRIIAESVSALNRYLDERLNMDAIAAAFRAGEFNNALVVKEAREILAAWPA